MELSDTLCWYCKRTGCDEHISGKLIPPELKPCEWIIRGKLPKGTKATKNKNGYHISSCPKFEPSIRYRQLQRKEYFRKVHCVETGEVYNSASDAARKTGIPFSKVYAICNGTRKKSNNNELHFAYLDEKEKL